MERISYEKFKKIFEASPGEPEFYVVIDGINEEYMIIKYKNKATFQRCGFPQGSEVIYFDSLDDLYKAHTIDGICLERDWSKVSIYSNDCCEDLQEFCDVYNIDLKIND